MSSPGYAAIFGFAPGSSKATPLCADGKVLVFDTPSVARHFMPLLGNGRTIRWDAAEETASFWPLAPDQMNRFAIVTRYDPYHQPAGSPIRTEARGLEWRHHAHYTDAFVQKGQFETQADGSLVNRATVSGNVTEV